MPKWIALAGAMWCLTVGVLLGRIEQAQLDAAIHFAIDEAVCHAGLASDTLPSAL